MTHATDRVYEQDMRRLRAMSLAKALMDEISDVLGDNDALPAVYDRLVQVLETNGACWTTEEERQALGFEPRDEKGWTPSDRLAHRNLKLEQMQRLMFVGENLLNVPPVTTDTLP